MGREVRKITTLGYGVKQDLLNRVISGLSSGALVFILGLQLGFSDFAKMQIYFTYGSLVYWICDFGLIGLAYVYSAQSNFSGFGSCWKRRAKFFMIAFALILFTLTLGILDYILTLLILVGLTESFVDSNLPVRQLFRSKMANTCSVTVRRFSQFGLLISFGFITDDLNLIHVVFIYGLPSVAVLISDLVYFSRFKNAKEPSLLNKSTKYFIQNSGTNLASLDYFIISLFGYQNLVYPYALGKKFYSFLLIPGTTFLKSTISSTDSIGKSLRDFRSHMTKVVFATALLSISAAVFFVIFSSRILGATFETSETFLSVSLIFLSILGAISTNLNGVLVSKFLYRRATVATFSSSVFYICLLYLGFTMDFNEYVVLIVAIYSNLIIEILIEIFLIFRIEIFWYKSFSLSIKNLFWRNR
jgi:hypothetical protein